MGSCKELKNLLDEMELRLTTKLDAISTSCDKIPEIEKKQLKIEKEITCAAMKIIDAEVYSRKFSLILHGLPVNSTSAVKAREEVNKVCDAIGLHHPLLAACRKLGNGDTAPIIIRFVDLQDLDNWVANSKKLKAVTINGNVLKLGVSPNLPPVLGNLKKSVFTQRENYPNSKVKYLPSYPYVYGVKADKTQFLPNVTREDLATALFSTP